MTLGVLLVATAAHFGLASGDHREPRGKFSEKEFVKVAAIAFTPPGSAPVDVSQREVDQFKRRSADLMEEHIRDAAKNGARFVVTPEFGIIGYPDIPGLSDEEDEFQSREQIRPYVEPINGPTVRRFSTLAKELNIYLIIGIAEVSGRSYYNTLVAIGPNGRTLETYRKINLFEGETNFLSAGNRRVTFDTEFGRIGMMTCYDIHFDNPATEMITRDHANVIAFATSWVGRGGMHEFQSFARDNEVYFVAANHTYFPDSGIINPDGTAQSHLHSGDGPVYGYLPLTKTKKSSVRETIRGRARSAVSDKKRATEKPEEKRRETRRGRK